MPEVDEDGARSGSGGGGVDYTYAVSKTAVSVPRYSFRGGPEVLSTILGTCWRLHYVRCPPIRRDQEQEQMHPCCRLNTQPEPLAPSGNRLGRWLKETETSSASRRSGGGLRGWKRKSWKQQNFG